MGNTRVQTITTAAALNRQSTNPGALMIHLRSRPGPGCSHAGSKGMIVLLEHASHVNLAVEVFRGDGRCTGRDLGTVKYIRGVLDALGDLPEPARIERHRPAGKDGTDDSLEFANRGDLPRFRPEDPAPLEVEEVRIEGSVVADDAMFPPLTQSVPKAVGQPVISRPVIG